jgi:hypothetical protein
MIAITLAALELFGGLTMYNRARQSKAKKQLLGMNKPVSIPILDKQLAKAAGRPSKLDRFISAQITNVLRHAVHTQAFEHVVTGLVNTKSSFYADGKPKSFFSKLRGK